MQQWHYRVPGGDEIGPVSSAGLKKLIATGRLGPDDEIRRAGGDHWRSVESLRTNKAADSSVSQSEGNAKPGKLLLVAIVGSLAIGAGATWGILAFLSKDADQALETTASSSPVDIHALEEAPPDSTDSVGEEQASIQASPTRSSLASPPRPYDDSEPSRPEETVDKDEQWRFEEYRRLARQIQSGTDVIYQWAWIPSTAIPTDQLVRDLDELLPQLKDPRVKSAARRARDCWRLLPQELPAFESDNALGDFLVNMMMGSFANRLAQAWSRFFDTMQEESWNEMLPIVRGALDSRASETFVEVGLGPSRQQTQRGDIVLRNTGVRSHHDVTIRVEFHRLDAAPIVNHYFLDEWEPGGFLELSRDPRLIYGARHVVATTVEAWIREGRQEAIRHEYPARRQAIEDLIALAAAIKANGEALQTALQEGRRLEGAWVLGEYSGQIGFELMQRARGFRSDEVRLYSPGNLSMYRTYLGSVSYNPQKLRYELRLVGKRGGKRGDPPKLPHSDDFLCRYSPSIVLFGNGKDFRGETSYGARIQLHPEGSPAATHLLDRPDQVEGWDTIPSLKVEPLDPQVLAAAPPAIGMSETRTGERRRWNAHPDEDYRSSVPQVYLTRDGQAVIWIASRGIGTARIKEEQLAAWEHSADRYAVSPDNQTLLTYYSNHFRLRDERTLAETGLKDPLRPNTFTSPVCNSATVTPNGRIAYGEANGGIHLLSPSGKLLHSAEQAGNVFHLLVPLQSDLLISTTRDGRFHYNLWDLKDLRNIGQLREAGQPMQAMASPDGSMLAVVEKTDRPLMQSISFWVVGTSERTQEIRFPNATAVALSPDWRRAIVAYRGQGPTYVFDLESGMVQAALLGHKASADSASFGPEGRTAVTGGEGWVILWSLPPRD